MNAISHKFLYSEIHEVAVQRAKNTNTELHTKSMYKDLNHKHRVTYNNTSFNPTKNST